MIRSILVLIAIGSIAYTEQAVSKTVFCYYESWAIWHRGHGKFTPANIPPTSCSHVTYTFLLPRSDGHIQNFNDADTLNKLIALRRANPKLKVLASIGGWSAGSGPFSQIVRNNRTRTTFVNSLAAFVAEHNLDGIDIDWEYPTERAGSQPADRQNYVLLLRQLRQKWGNSKVITAAVGAGRSFISKAYDVRAMSQLLDFINLMTYDFNMWRNSHSRTAMNSPLYAAQTDTDKSMNQASAVEAWIRAGAAPGKLLLGLAFYGRNYQLRDAGRNGLGAPTVGPGQRGPYTQQAGFKEYSEICLDLKHGGWTQRFDRQTQTPYAFKGTQWIGYDNPKSIVAKARFAVSKGLGGVMMWAIDGDDLHGDCGGGALPLLRALNSVMRP